MSNNTTTMQDALAAITASHGHHKSYDELMEAVFRADEKGYMPYAMQAH